MKIAIPFSFLFCLHFGLSGQEIQTISTGAGYNFQSYFSLSTGEEKLVANATWDIAFAVYSPFTSGVFINESAGTVQGQSVAAIELYDGLTDDFSIVPDPEFLADYRLYNPEESWEIGAFNETRDPEDPFDYGWGFYNFQTHEVVGARVFVIKLRDGSYKKMEIQSMAASMYTFRVANLDGSDEHTYTINKNDFPGQTLAYFSLTTGETVAVEPDAGYDLIYQRYISPVYEPVNQIWLQYAVTGIVSGLHVEVAVASEVDPDEVNVEDFLGEFTDEIGAIGHDWKSFTGTSWVLPEDRVYFVKTADNHIWKLWFIDFEGSTTGTAVFEKTDLGELTSGVISPEMMGIRTLLYPNPSPDQLYIALELPSDFIAKATLVATDFSGRQVLNTAVNLSSGFQVLEADMQYWAPGTYSFNLIVGADIIPLGMVSKL
jgi:hypothetical protein